MTTAPTRPSGALAGGEYDALADLFLGEAAPRIAGPARRTPAAAGATITAEALMLGHLPVLAGAWVTQYAREVSEQRAGWVGVLSVRAGQVAVELIGAVGHGDEVSADAHASLEAALHAGARAARHWLIRCEPPAEPAVTQVDGVQRVTLLCGADEAAIVASYQTLKQVHERGGRSIAVAIMGSSGAQAQEAVARLSRASESFLGHAVPMAACVPAIGPGRTVTLYRGPIEGDPPALVKQALRWLRDAAAPSMGRAAPPVEAASVIAPARPADQPTASPLIPGLRALRARCPLAPGVELALDESGTLHLLIMHGGEDAVSDLSAAGAWATENLAVLRLIPGCESLQEMPPVLHLFTERPSGLRRLLASPIRVHALGRAGTAVVSIDLN